MISRRGSTFRAAVIEAVALAGLLGTPSGVRAQALKDVQASDAPLVLKAQGSFFVGGEKVTQTRGELGDLGPGGAITLNQMYVRYMVPQGGDGNVPVVMLHGATLTGTSREPARLMTSAPSVEGEAGGAALIARAVTPSGAANAPTTAAPTRQAESRQADSREDFHACMRTPFELRGGAKASAGG